MSQPTNAVSAEKVRELRDKWRKDYAEAIEHDKRHGLRETTIELGGKAVAADELDALLSSAALETRSAEHGEHNGNDAAAGTQGVGAQVDSKGQGVVSHSQSEGSADSTASPDCALGQAPTDQSIFQGWPVEDAEGLCLAGRCNYAAKYVAQLDGCWLGHTDCIRIAQLLGDAAVALLPPLPQEAAADSPEVLYAIVLDKMAAECARHASNFDPATPTHHYWDSRSEACKLGAKMLREAAPRAGTAAEPWRIERERIAQSSAASSEPPPAAREADQGRGRWSVTYGELPESVRKLIEPHVWDNGNISEQRDWCLQQLAARDAELRALSARWRTIERGGTAWDDGYESALMGCADDLDRLLDPARILTPEGSQVTGSAPRSSSGQTDETQE